MSYTTDSRTQFVDTNVLVYAYDASAGRKSIVANKLISDLWRSSKGCLSIQVLQEFHNVVTRKLIRPLSLSESRLILEDFSTWKIHKPEVDDVLSAIRFQENYQITFWDSLVVQSANQLGCAVIWSEDLTHEQYYGNCQLLNPFHVY